MVVTTPQAVSLADTRRAVHMYRKVDIPTLGLVENISHCVCPGCGRESDVFGKGGGERMAAELEVGVPRPRAALRADPFGGDTGVPI